MPGCQSFGSDAKLIRQTNMIKAREGLGDGLDHFYLFGFFCNIFKAEYFLKALLGKTQVGCT